MRLPVLTSNLREMRSRADSSGSIAYSPVGASDCLISPPMIADAMLPLPMNATFKFHLWMSGRHIERATGKMRLIRNLVNRNNGHGVRKCRHKDRRDDDNKWEMHKKLHGGVANEIFGLESQNSEQWQHPERIDEVGERLGDVVDHHGPAKVSMQLIGRGHDVGR